MISICMIVKNEEEILEKCLQHLIPFGYEIIIADTGSTDRTKEIALKYTDKVYDYTWNQDFAAARNFSVSLAANDYILCIDSDEIVTQLDKVELEKVVKENPAAVGRLIRINDFSRNGESYSGRERVSRLFSRNDYCYEGIIHEQLVRKDSLPVTFYNIPIEMHHEGYEGDLTVRRKKTERNISLLKKQMELEGEDPYLLYQLGKSFYMQEDYETACEYFDKALYYDLDPRLEYVQDMVESFGYSLINANRYETALQLLNVYNEFAVNADFVYLVGLIYMNNAKFNEAVNEFHKASKMKEYKVDGVNSYRAYYNIGVIYECLGSIDLAKEFYHKCGSYQPAMNRLNSF